MAILSSPKTFVGNYGETAVFAASADGEGLTYQWQYQNGNSTAWWNSSMAGSNTPSISVQFTQAREVYRYRCKVTDGAGNVRYTDAAGFMAEQTTWNFTYNSDGLRTGRTDGDTTYSYIYNGSQLSQMAVGSNTLTFAYDASGKPLTVTLNGTVYYYTTNLQGDITGILDASGSQIVTYTYDAWGNVTVVSDHAIADYNPLTYRGYVYDYETGLYYLQSRYYDPQIGRFLNADVLVTTGQGFTGNNMFAYCGNNASSRFDPSGTMHVPVNAMIYEDGGSDSSPSTPKPLSADELAIEWFEQVFSASQYVGIEFGTIMYSMTQNGITTYHLTITYVGDPHSVLLNIDDVPDGATMVAFLHTHPNGDGFSGKIGESEGDIGQAHEFKVDLYLVGPSLQMLFYDHNSDKVIPMDHINNIALTTKRKEKLYKLYHSFWEEHSNCASCLLNAYTRDYMK